MGVALIGALALSYAAIFKNYHAALEKQESLTALFKNPNARVVSGKKGQKIIKQINAVNATEVTEKKAVTKKLKSGKKAKVSEVDATLAKVNELLKAKQ